MTPVMVCKRCSGRFNARVKVCTHMIFRVMVGCA